MKTSCMDGMAGKFDIKVVSTESHENGNRKTICEVIYHTFPVYSQIIMSSTEALNASGRLLHLISHIKTNSVVEVYKVLLYQRDFAQKTEATFLFDTCFNQRKAKELFHVVNSILSPMITSGDVFFSKLLLSEILLPELKDYKLLLSKLIGLINDNPSICSNWSKLLRSLIQYLCHHNKTTISSMLLDRDFFDSSTCKRNGESIFHRAARDASGRSIEVLISLLEPEDRKTVTTARDADGNTPLAIALRHRNKITTKCLIRAGVDARGLIFEAVETDSYEFLQGVVEVCASLCSDQGTPLRAMMNEFDDSTCFTWLMFAVMKQHVRCALHLLLGGADPNTPHPQTGDTALHIAASLNNATLVKVLIVFEAQTTLENNFGETASDKAKMRGHDEILSIFDDLRSADLEAESSCLKATQIELKNPEGVTLLSLDGGGGTKGLLLIQTLIALEKRMKSIATASKSLTGYFDYLAGSGTGGMVSLLLTYCSHLTYLDMMALMFGVTDNLSNSTTAAMESLFKELYGAATTISSSTKPRLIIPVRSIRPRCKLSPGHLVTNFDVNGQELRVWEAAQCTIPTPFCPFYSSSKEALVDVTLLANNPTMAAIAKIYMQAGTESKKRVKVGCVISLGTGNHGINGSKTMASNAAKVVAEDLNGRVTEHLHQLNNLEIEKARVWCNSTESSYFRLAPGLAKDDHEDSTDHTSIIECMYYNHLYLKREAKNINAIAQLLLTK